MVAHRVPGSGMSTVTVSDRQYARALVNVLTVLVALDYADRSALGAVAPALRDDLGLASPSWAGSGPPSASSAASPPWWPARYVDRVPRLRMLALSALTWSVAMVATGSAQGLVWLLLARASSPSCSPPSARPTRRSSATPCPPYRARALGRIGAGQLAGGAVGVAVGAPAVALLDWRWAFFILAVPALLLARRLATHPEPRRRGRPGGAAAVRPRSPRRLCATPTVLLVLLAVTAGSYYLAGASAFSTVFAVARYDVSTPVADLALLALGVGAVARHHGRQPPQRRAHRERPGRRPADLDRLAYLSPRRLAAALLARTCWSRCRSSSSGRRRSPRRSRPSTRCASTWSCPAMRGRAEAVRTFVRAVAEGGAPLVFGLVAARPAATTRGCSWPSSSRCPGWSPRPACCSSRAAPRPRPGTGAGGGGGGTGRVLVLRALGLGDLLTAVPALRGLRRAHPGARLTLAAPAWLAPVVPLLGAVDELVATAPLAPLDPALHGADLAVNLHGRGPQSTALLAATRPGQLVAYGDHLAGGGARGRTVVPAAGRARHPGRPRRPRHQPAGRTPGVRRCGGRAPRLGGGVAGAGRSSAGPRSPAGCPAAWSSPPGPAEQERAAEVAALAGLPPDAVVTGLPLPDLAGLVAGARLLLASDTGVAHLATAVRHALGRALRPGPARLVGTAARPAVARRARRADPQPQRQPGPGPGPAGRPAGAVLDAALALLAAFRPPTPARSPACTSSARSCSSSWGSASRACWPGAPWYPLPGAAGARRAARGRPARRRDADPSTPRWCWSSSCPRCSTARRWTRACSTSARTRGRSGCSALGLVVFTALAVGTVAHARRARPAVVGGPRARGDRRRPRTRSPPSAIGRRVGMRTRLQTLIEGEGLLNDATALVLYSVAVEVADRGRVLGPPHTAWLLVLASVGGPAGGAGRRLGAHPGAAPARGAAGRERALARHPVPRLPAGRADPRQRRARGRGLRPRARPQQPHPAVLDVPPADPADLEGRHPSCSRAASSSLIGLQLPDILDGLGAYGTGQLAGYAPRGRAHRAAQPAAVDRALGVPAAPVQAAACAPRTRCQWRSIGALSWAGHARRGLARRGLRPAAAHGGRRGVPAAGTCCCSSCSSSSSRPCCCRA